MVNCIACGVLPAAGTNQADNNKWVVGRRYPNLGRVRNNSIEWLKLVRSDIVGTRKHIARESIKSVHKNGVNQDDIPTDTDAMPSKQQPKY